MAQNQTKPRDSVFEGQRIDVLKPGSDAECEALSEAPAKLCLRPSGACFTPPKHDPPFRFEPDASVVSLARGNDAVLFRATASACGSGSLQLLSLLHMNEGILENLLPEVAISNQGEYKIWREPKISPTAMFVTADAVWGDGETHFARHRFLIKTYVFGEKLPMYFLQDEYVTRSKYPSLDEVDKIEVLERERPEILSRIKRQTN